MAIVGTILIVLGYFVPYRNIGQLDIYYYYAPRLGEGADLLYQGEWYTSAFFQSAPAGITLEEGRRYRITLVNYETPYGWKGNASDSKIFFWKLPVNETSTPEKVMPLAASSAYEFIFDRATSLSIQLATNLSKDQMKEQGYYGNWILTFTIEWTAPGNYDCILIGTIFLVAGSIVIVISKW